ncbi:LacI family DNA-binding transcriptional regulator [Lentisphaerota bacterium ZTH]|nr:LacI family DNA-binding transcriptional regulator [Lentisphaerota bacterium]WET05523.1 LacI family DNA-binding transcriptional regulator [Lentisphaerota bacterium ZTH]
MSQRKITIKEFAGKLGVSTATVSRAFNTRGRISAKTRQYILNKATELGYCANVHAKNLSRQDTSTIGFFYPVINSEEPDYFIDEIMFGLNNRLQKVAKTLQVNPFPEFCSEETLNLCRQKILSGSTGGVIIVAGSKGSKVLFETAKSAAVPYVIIGHLLGIENNAVQFDNEHGASLAGNYFRKINRSHPAYIGGHLDSAKKQGFINGLKVSEDQIFITHCGYGFRAGADAFQKVIKSMPEVDCVLCANDPIAMGFISAAQAHNIKIPEDIAVIGFDDIRPSRFFVPGLSSVSLRLSMIGMQAVEMILKNMNGEPCPTQHIECDLVLRESS